MAKKAHKAVTPPSEQPAGAAAMVAAENTMEAFADDLGRLLGTARAKAEDWLEQRKAILDHLTSLRDTANGLIARLGGTFPAEPTARRGRKPGGPAASANRHGPGRPAGTASKKRTLSPEARARIAAAQRARWARQKKNQGS